MLYECKTHGIWDADTASGCPDCVRCMRTRIADLELAAKENARYSQEMREEFERRGARIAELEYQLRVAADALSKAGYVSTASAIHKSLMVR